jgi:dinuclear metal center YbgI/SA1388 family protein
MQLIELVTYANRLLAVENFNDYCPNGLQVQGRPEVQTLIGGVTACQALLDTAIEQQADAVLAHHGWFWKGENPCIVGMKQRRLAALLRHNISLIAYHLPLDAHPTLGNNAQLAQCLDLTITGTAGSNGRTPGLVMLGEPAEPVSGTDFAARIEARLQRKPLHIPGSDTSIRRLAWCTGAAQSSIEIALNEGADAFLTGEASEPTVHFARENGLHFFAAGHHATERYGVQALGAHLAQQFALHFTFIDINNPV